MFERHRMSRRTTIAKEKPVSRPSEDATRASPDLTRAQARALSRCTPLTPAQFAARGRAADEGLVSLRVLLDENGDARGTTGADAANGG